MAGARTKKGRFRKSTKKYSGLVKGLHQGLRDTDWQICTGDSTGTWIVLLSHPFPPEKQDRVDKAEAEKNKQEAMLTTTSVHSTVDVQPVVQRWAAQSPCPFLTEIACVWGQTAPCEVTGQMLWSWDEMHGSRKSVSTGGFFFFSPWTHTAAEFNSRAT